MSARNIIRKSNVETICTTDDPVDTLEWHKKIAEDPTIDVVVGPSYRPDKAVALEKPDYLEYLAKLGNIDSYDKLVAVLKEKLEFFVKCGCRVTDHGVDAVPYAEATIEEVEAIFAKRLAGELPTALEAKQFKTALMQALAKEYARHGLVMQLHFGVIRDNSKRLFRKLGLLWYY